MGIPQRWQLSWKARGPIAGLALLLIVALAGCTSTVTVTGETGTSSATPTTAAAAASPTVAVPAGADACLSQSGFSGAVAATAGGGFDDVAFPAHSVSTSITASHGGDGRFTIRQFDVCTASTSTSSVRSFFASGLPHAGWTQAPLYPYDGAYQASCGDPYCWKKDHAPRYVSLESVTSHSGGVVTYHMRLAIPPHEPDCTPDSAGIYGTRKYDTTLTDSPSPGFPAPPLTKDGLGSFGDSGTKTQGGFSGMCSAGSSSTINSFFNTELPAHGWHHSTPPSSLTSACGVSGTQWWKGNDIFSWNIEGSAGASGTFWGWGLCHLD
ncbi:MAG TPA: hypothetical protein VGP82_05035 [Ktedonobacterales bacterium]|jgi:hypothetical protein|nr:hypothetical protein [Ktedonobacterales bacterium]